MYQFYFFDGEVRSNLPFLKRAETVFLLAADTVKFKQAYLKTIAELQSKSLCLFCDLISFKDIIPFLCTSAKKMLNFR